MNCTRTHGFHLLSRIGGRSAFWAPLTVALALGMGACNSTSDSDGGSSATDPTEQPGGKTDNPDEANFKELTMDYVPQAPGKMDVVRTPEGQWFFRLIGPAGDVFLSSNTYQQKVSGLNAILSVEENGVLLDRYRVAPFSEEECGFELLAGNNQVIAKGPAFRDCAEADARIAATRDLVAGIVQHKATVSDGARFDLTRREDKQWYFELQAADHRPLLGSHAYSSRTDAITGIESVRNNGKLPERYRLDANSDGTYSIVLRATNGKDIAHGGPFAQQNEAQGIVDESVELLISERVGNPW